MATLAARCDPRTRWAGFSRAFVGSAVALFAAGICVLLAIDPYDTGRTGILGRTGLPQQYPTTANASRARNPAYSAAIFGNSHVQQLRPERLDPQTGLSFVSLAIPGSIPADQLAVLTWFLKERGPSARAVVIGLDNPWCQPQMRYSERFPEWLYHRSLAGYIAGLVRWRSFEAAAARIAYLRSGSNEARPDGYWDYVPIFEKMGLSDAEASRRRLAIATPSFAINPKDEFPAIEALKGTMTNAPQQTRFVLLRPPIYMSGLPAPGTEGMRVMRSCAAKIEQIAETRPGTLVIDLLRPGPIAQDPGNFYDHDHYRDPVAVEIEGMIASSLRAE